MSKKELNPTKTFWESFLIVGGFFFALPLLVCFIDGSPISKLFSWELFVGICWLALSGGGLFAALMAFIVWIKKRNQKMNDHDDINDLMREYLEMKLREEREKEENAQE